MATRKIAILALFTVLVAIFALSSTTQAQDTYFGTYSNWMHIGYYNDTADFNVEFLNLNVGTAQNLDWTYVDIREYVLPLDTFPNASSVPVKAGQFQFNTLSADNITTPFQAEFIGQTGDISIETGLNNSTTNDTITTIIENGVAANGYLFQKDQLYAVDGGQKLGIQGSFKFGLNVNDWPWQVPEVDEYHVMQLRVVLNFSGIPSGLSDESFIYDDEGYLSKIHIYYAEPTTFAPGSATGWDINIGKTCNILGGTTTNLLRVYHEFDFPNAMLYFEFPYFNNSLIYDPDVSPLLADDSAGDDDSETDNTLTIVVSIVVPIAVLTVLLVLVVMIAVAGWRYFVFRRNRVSDEPDNLAINF